MTPPIPEIQNHPLFGPLVDAINQAMYGKGERHGGATVPFLEQPIFHYAKMHGRAFLTGQAAKKLEEAASTRNDEAFITELLGAIVYTGAAVLWERQKMEREKRAQAAAPENVPMHDGPGGLQPVRPIADFVEMERERQRQEKNREGTWRPTLRDAYLDSTRAGDAVQQEREGGGIDRAWHNLDPAAWTRMEEKVRAGYAGMDETMPAYQGEDRRSKHHNKLTAPDAGQHPRKKATSDSCSDCASSICDLCDGGQPKRRTEDYAKPPCPEVDEHHFYRTGRCTCGAPPGPDSFHHISCGSLSVDHRLDRAR